MDTQRTDSDERPAGEALPEIQQPQVGETSLVLTAEPLRSIEPVLPSPPPLRTRPRWGALVVVLTALAGLAGAAYWYWSTTGPPPTGYKTARVDRGPVAATVTATGTVNAVISVQVGSQVSGIVQRLYADYNSEVTEGQVIAQIDPAPFQARADQARSNLKTATGTLEKARIALEQRAIELDRMAALRRQQFVAQSELDLARTNHRDAAAQVTVSQGQLDQAKASLAAAELDLEHTTIRSPVTGIVVSRNVDVGQTVAASLQAPTLFVIAQDLTRMQVNANVSEADIGGVAEGKGAEFMVDAYPAQLFRGTVVQVRNAPVSIQNVVTYDVVISVENTDLKLKPGMTANVSIVTASKNEALRVPSAALRFKLPGTPTERKRSVVWVLAAEGIPRPITVQPGISDSTFTEVLEGDLKDGDAVIVGIEAAEGSEQQTLPPGFGVGPKVR
jgi:HlyD family secretion protein